MPEGAEEALRGDDEAYTADEGGASTGVAKKRVTKKGTKADAKADSDTESDTADTADTAEPDDE
jgi:hypothetical protein